MILPVHPTRLSFWCNEHKHAIGEGIAVGILKLKAGTM